MFTCIICMEHNQNLFMTADISKNLFCQEARQVSQVIETVNKNNMATLTQAPTNGFGPLSTSIEDNAPVLNNITHHVAVSKLKTQQTPVYIPHVSSKNTILEPVKENGVISPTRPPTTSENRPPKIKLLNRSPAFNGTSNDICTEKSEEYGSQCSNEYSFPETEKSEGELEMAQENMEHLLVDTKEVNDVVETIHPTPSKLDNTVMPQKQSSFEYSSAPSSNSSLNRENSLDYKDSTGVDLHEFMIKTLRENPRDRLMLLKLEKDFTDFINDPQKKLHKYPQMTSYNRMLIHRVAAYFGLDHNVDSSGKSVVISKTPSSRVPETRFQTYCSREYTDEEICAVPKSILHRSNSSDDGGTPPRYSSPLNVDRRFCLEDKRSKSIEEREEDYIKAKERIFNKDLLETLSTSSTSSTVDGTELNRSHELHNNDSILSEKESAIAAVVAATGRKTSHSNKKTYDRKNLRELHFSPFQQFGHQSAVPSERYTYSSHTMYSAGSVPHLPIGGEGYPQHAAITINPQTGQPMLGPDGNPMYYSTNFQHSASPVAFVPNQSGTYVAPPQQQHSAQYVPLYYVSPSNTVSQGTNSQQGSQLYMVQQTQSGQVFIPTQGGAVDTHQQSSTTGPTVFLSSHHIHYQGYANQLSNLSLNERHSCISPEESQGKTATTPTSPVDSPLARHPHDISSQRQIVYLQQNGRVVQSPVYNPQNGYQLQYFQTLPGSSYPMYSVNQHAQVDSSHYNNAGMYTQTLSPPLRSPNPSIVQSHYVNANSHSVQSNRALSNLPTQTLQGQSVHGGNRPRIVSGIMPNPRACSAVYMPVAGGATNTMVVPGQYPNVVAASAYPFQAVYRSEKGGLVDGVAASDHHLQHANVPRNMLALNQKHVIQMQPTYQPSYPYLTQHQRYFPNHVVNPAQRKYRAPRHAVSNPNIRISRPNSSGSENDQKTVNHILEICEFPDSVTSDADAIFDEIKSSGARILKINSSVSQSLNSSHNTNHTAQRPTILAIFKSANEAKKALETVTSPYYKLRVSQKSPTHFTSDQTSSASTSPTKGD